MLGSFTLLVALAVAYRKNRMFVWGALGLSYAVLAVQSIEARDMDSRPTGRALQAA